MLYHINPIKHSRGVAFNQRWEGGGGGGTRLFFASFLTKGKLLKERICSSRSKFFLLKVDPISESYLIKRKRTSCKSK